MYIIINKTKNSTIKHEGDFPILDDLLNEGDKIIIISKYSNTIKVPVLEIINGVKEWEWEDYNIPFKS